jgi:hypothetical protein
VVPNIFALAGLAGFAGGAPAGVVDAKANIGLAGVAATVVGVVVWLVGVGVLLPKSEELVFAFPNIPPAAGAAGVGVALEVLLALFAPNKPLVDGVVDELLLPNRPPVVGAAALVVAPPNSPPAGVGVVVVLAPPKRPAVAGVVEAPPNRPPADVVGVAEDEEAAAPPKRPPAAGFCAAAAF